MYYLIPGLHVHILIQMHDGVWLKLATAWSGPHATHYYIVCLHGPQPPLHGLVPSHHYMVWSPAITTWSGPQPSLLGLVPSHHYFFWSPATTTGSGPQPPLHGLVPSHHYLVWSPAITTWSGPQPPLLCKVPATTCLFRPQPTCSDGWGLDKVLVAGDQAM